jgi:hypothetical protein
MITVYSKEAVERCPIFTGTDEQIMGKARETRAEAAGREWVG